MRFVKINSYYKEHNDAIKCMSNFGIQLNIIPNESPYLLAQDGPDIVIHPNSHMIREEYPAVKFLGPNCKFPNFDYSPKFGFDALSYTNKKSPIKSECVFINTLGEENNEFIKTLESNHYVRVWGRQTNCIGYMGPLNCNSFELYNNSDICAADNESEILKILSLNKVCYTPFTYMGGRLYGCINLLESKEEQNKAKLLINKNEY